MALPILFIFVYLYLSQELLQYFICSKEVVSFDRHAILGLTEILIIQHPIKTIFYTQIQYFKMPLLRHALK